MFDRQRILSLLKVLCSDSEPICRRPLAYRDTADTLRHRKPREISEYRLFLQAVIQPERVQQVPLVFPRNTNRVVHARELIALRKHKTTLLDYEPSFVRRWSPAKNERVDRLANGMILRFIVGIHGEDLLDTIADTVSRDGFEGLDITSIEDKHCAICMMILTSKPQSNVVIAREID